MIFLDENDILKSNNNNMENNDITRFKEAFIENNIEIIPLNFKGIINKDGKFDKKVGFPFYDTGKTKIVKNKKGIEEKKKILLGHKDLSNKDFIEKNIMYDDYYNSGIAIKTGKVNNISIVDIDTKDEDKIKTILEYLELESLDETTCIETNKGYHLYFKYNEKLKTTGNLRPDIFGEKSVDIRNDGALIFAPPTKYTCGEFEGEYKFTGDLELENFIEEINGGGLIEEISEKFLEIQKDKPKPKKSINIDTNIDTKITGFSPPISPPSSKAQSEEDDFVNVEKPKEEKKLSDEDFEKIKMALLKLDKKRSTNYKSWLDVGMALFNNGDNMDNKTMRLWEEFSKQCPEQYDDMVCFNKWMTFKPREGGLTIASIFYWLKEDNPEEHKILMGVADKKDPLRFKKKFYKNLTFSAEDDKWKGRPNEDGVTELMNQEVMRTKKNEYIQIVDEETHYLMNKKDIIDEYAMYSFPNPDRMGVLNPFNIFLNNINRRNIIGLKFDPTMTEDENYFNIYKGFQYKVTDDNDYSKIEDYLFHIKDVWANGNDETYNYILNWFAHIYQKPEKKTLVAIVIPSKTQGNGKNLALKPHSEIMKDLYYSTAQVEEIVGNFNPSAEARLLINLNECTWAGRKSQSGILKALVTEDKMTINNKNVKPYMIENFSNVIVTSNDENPIEVEQKNRRYFVLDIKEEKLSDERTKAILNTDNQVLFNYFMNRNISDFDSTKFTKTGREKDMKEFSFETDFMYWKHCLENNCIENGEESFCFDELEDYDYKILKSCVIESYNKMNYGYKQKMSDSIFWKSTKYIFPRLKLVNANKKHKPRCHLYDIHEMKKDFNKYFDTEYFK